MPLIQSCELKKVPWLAKEHKNVTQCTVLLVIIFNNCIICVYLMKQGDMTGGEGLRSGSGIVLAKPVSDFPIRAVRKAIHLCNTYWYPLKWWLAAWQLTLMRGIKKVNVRLRGWPLENSIVFTYFKLSIFNFIHFLYFWHYFYGDPFAENILGSP